MEAKIEKVFDLMENEKGQKFFSREGYRIIIRGKFFKMIIDTWEEKIKVELGDGYVHVIPLREETAKALKNLLDEIPMEDAYGWMEWKITTKKEEI